MTFCLNLTQHTVFDCSRFGLLFQFCSATKLGKIQTGAKPAAVKGDSLKTNAYKVFFKWQVVKGVQLHFFEISSIIGGKLANERRAFSKKMIATLFTYLLI